MQVELTEHKTYLLIKIEQFGKSNQQLEGDVQPQTFIRQAPVITSAINFISTKQAFSSFIAEVMVDLIVLNTNQEARRKIDVGNRCHPDAHRTWIPVDDTEMIAFIGLNLLAGLHKSNHGQFHHYGLKKKADTATMSRNRFTD